MAILHAIGAEGFRSSADLQAQIQAIGGLNGGSVDISTTVRAAALGVRSFFGNGGFPYITVSAEPIICVEAWIYNSAAAGFSTANFLKLMDASGNAHCTLERFVSGANGYLRLMNANGTQVGSDYPTGVVTTWFHIGIKLTVGAAGTATVRVDDVLVHDAVSSDFLNGATASVGRIEFGSGFFNNDDIVIQQDDAFLGSGVHLVASFPSAAGDSAQLTPSAGANYENVDETDPDDDTTYNSSATVGHRDLYNVDNLPAYTGNVLGATIWARMRKDNGGTEQAKLAIKTNSVVYYGSDESLTNSYALYKKQYVLNPNTGLAFTQAEINALQIGVEVV